MTAIKPRPVIQIIGMTQNANYTYKGSIRNDIEEVEVTCWGCKCEDICLPCPSHRGCKNCEHVCGCGDRPCQCGDHVKSHPKLLVWFDWSPGCANIKTRKRLMKRTITKKIPHYRWVVECLCPKCEMKAPAAAPLPGEDVPPPPPIEAKLKIGVAEVAVGERDESQRR